jgi:glycosyltransferase involved in cell wall biosynthesis
VYVHKREVQESTLRNCWSPGSWGWNDLGHVEFPRAAGEPALGAEAGEVMEPSSPRGFVRRQGVSGVRETPIASGALQLPRTILDSREDSVDPRPPCLDLSLVIPVYNGSQTINEVVEQIQSVLADLRYEIVLVNDGSSDRSEDVCADLVERYPSRVFLVQLARNFGEHNAVLAGFKHTCGQYVAVLDDDGQNRAEDALRMFVYAKEHDVDVVYARYRNREHPTFRILGSWFNDKMATLLLKKPRDLYLSSFKVMRRFVVDEIVKYSGPFPYIDGLILRVTRRIGQIDVEHRQRQAGRSGYTLSKLIGLWLNMFVGFSIVPLRLSVVLGMTAAILSLLMFVEIIVDKIWINPNVTVGIPSVLACIVFFAAVQLVVLGTLGEYVGRMFLHQNGTPQYVVRYSRRMSDTAGAAQAKSQQQPRQQPNKPAFHSSAR